jgi:hypothetical protein
MIMKLLVSLNTFTHPINVKHLVGLLIKYEHLFVGALGNFETSEVKLNLKEDAKPYHAKAFTVPAIYHDTLKNEIERLVKVGFLVSCSESK